MIRRRTGIVLVAFGTALGCTSSEPANGAPLTCTLPDAGPPRATHVAAGQFHSCARFSDGSVRCWGFSNQGKPAISNALANARGRPRFRASPARRG